MSLEALNNALNNAINEISQETPRIVLSIARETKSDVQNRIQQKGTNAKGQKLGQYSTRQAAAFRFLGKSTKASAESKVKALAKKGGGLSYEKFRELNGRQTKHVDLTFTGRMFQNIDITSENSREGVSEVTIGGKSSDTKHKIEENEKRYGKFLEPSAKEIEEKEELFKEEIEHILKMNLNGL